jgi:hypothetical protein
MLAISDVDPLQVPPTVVDVATPCNGATVRTAAAISANVTTTTNDGTTQPSIPHFPLAKQIAVTPSLSPFPTTNKPSTNTNTNVPKTNLTPHLYLPGLSRKDVGILTRSSPNDSVDVLQVRATVTMTATKVPVGIVILSSMALSSQEGNETYCPWGAKDEAASYAEEEKLPLRELSLRGNHVKEHHGLVCKRHEVLAEPNKMAPTEGHLIPEKAHKFKTPLHYFMPIFHLIYWKSIVKQTNEYIEW